MDEYCKCRFCQSYDEYEGCMWGCENYGGYTPNKNKIIEAAKERGISVVDMIALINLE